MIYKTINDTLDAGAVNQLIDKKLQHVFDKIIRARQPQEWQNILSLLVRHPQPLTLLYLLLCSYFKLTGRKYVRGEKIDWQDDVAWLRANIPDNHLLQQVVTEIEAACYAFNGDLTDAAEKYRALYYQNTAINSFAENKHEDLDARQAWLIQMAILLEPANYDVAALDVPDIKMPENLQKEYEARTPLFHFYCDANYFKIFAKAYIEGVKTISDDYFILAVVGNMDDEARALAETFTQAYHNFYIIEEQIPEQFQKSYNLATWCACRRFLYLETLFNQLDGLYILTTDIDIVFSAEYQKAVEYGADAAISYSCNKTEIFNPRGIWSANQLFLTDTEFSRQFCHALSYFIRQKMADEKKIYWYLDQFVLFRLWHQMGIANHPTCKNIDDVSFNKQAVIFPIEFDLKNNRSRQTGGTVNITFDNKTLRPCVIIEDDEAG